MSTTKRNVLLVILVLCIGWAAYTFYTAWRLQDPAFQRERTLGDAGMIENGHDGMRDVNLDELATLRPKDEGTREILPLTPIRFDALIKEGPKKITTKYLMEALNLMRINPLPKVTHRMFIETANGHIMPVYVWDNAAKDFETGQAPVTMTGYHVYTYSKGPAIVVDGLI